MGNRIDEYLEIHSGEDDFNEDEFDELIKTELENL